MHDLERQKYEAEGLLYEAAEEDEVMQEVNEALTRFEAWAGKVRRLFADPEYVPTYEEMRLAIKVLGAQAKVFRLMGNSTTSSRWHRPRLYRYYLDDDSRNSHPQRPACSGP